ncbi:unnamed protein product [Brassica rapa subsp. narinosa]
MSIIRLMMVEESASNSEWFSYLSHDICKIRIDPFSPP